MSGGVPHPTLGGTPFNTWIEGEGVVTSSQVVFYSLNRNGYGKVIFSVSLLTSHVGGDPIPGTGGGVLCYVVGGMFIWFTQVDILVQICCYLFVFAVFRSIFRTSIKIIIQ